MSVMDKIKSMFSGGSNAATDDHSAHDHNGHDHSHEPVAPTPAEPTAEPASDTEDTPA